jgi:hypothetical protein
MLPAGTAAGSASTFAVHVASPITAFTASTAPAPAAETSATVSSIEWPLPLPVISAVLVLDQAAPSFTTTGLSAESQVETQNFTFDLPRAITTSGMIWQLFAEVAAGASMQRPSRQTCDPQSPSPEQREPTHLPSSH